MRDPSLDPSLLEPSLSASHDFHGFDRPWQPSSLAMAAFFCGSVTGGWLVAKNFERLGVRGRFGRTFAVFIAWFVVATTIAAVVLSRHEPGEVGDTGRLLRFVNRGGTIVIALGMLRDQHRRFRIFEAQEGEPASLWGLGLAAFAIGVVIDILAVGILVYAISQVGA